MIKFEATSELPATLSVGACAVSGDALDFRRRFTGCFLAGTTVCIFRSRRNWRSWRWYVVSSRHTGQRRMPPLAFIAFSCIKMQSMWYQFKQHRMRMISRSAVSSSSTSISPASISRVVVLLLLLVVSPFSPLGCWPSSFFSFSGAASRLSTIPESALSL
jgi:hypothetical protein